MDITAYVVTRSEDKAVIGHILVPDENNCLLPDRTTQLGIETCGRMYHPVKAQFQSGQQVAVLAVEGQTPHPPVYDIARVVSVPEPVVRKALAMSEGDKQYFAQYILAFLDSP